MTILIANIGTSDLVVKIDGFDYFFPLDAPNIDKSSLDIGQAEAWKDKDSYIQEFLCNELNVPFSEKKEFCRPRAGQTADQRAHRAGSSDLRKWQIRRENALAGVDSVTRYH
jgi:hypothetical protein